MIAKILAGFLVAAVIGLGVVGYLYRGEIRANAALTSALNTALEANASLVTERDTAKREAARNAAISATAIRENRALDEKVAAIKERLRNGQACLVDPADAAALDGLFQ